MKKFQFVKFSKEELDFDEVAKRYLCTYHVPIIYLLLITILVFVNLYLGILLKGKIIVCTYIMRIFKDILNL